MAFSVFLPASALRCRSHGSSARYREESDHQGVAHRTSTRDRALCGSRTAAAGPEPAINAIISIALLQLFCRFRASILATISVNVAPDLFPVCCRNAHRLRRFVLEALNYRVRFALPHPDGCGWGSGNRFPFTMLNLRQGCGFARPTTGPF